LGQLGFGPKERFESFHFKDTEEIIVTFQNQGYLDRAKAESATADTPDDDKYVYYLGPRAEVELPEEQLLEFMAEVDIFGSFMLDYTYKYLQFRFVDVWFFTRGD
jgi:hypothetical protein